MVRSMTGYGHAEAVRNDIKVTAEIKSVNNRYLDVNVRMPRSLNAFESQVRSLLKEFADRGKIDCYLTIEDTGENRVKVIYDHAAAGQYLEALRQISEEFSIPLSIDASRLSSYPDVLTLEHKEEDEEELLELITEAVNAAGEQFVSAREKEGEFLKEDILAKLDTLLTELSFISSRAPELVAAYRAGLMAKVKELLGDRTIDEGRILQEVTIYADRVSIDEEIVRLRSHVDAVREAFRAKGSIGKKLDFLAQEMNRESNTILSKTDDIDTGSHAIELKTIVEKIREQVQNIE